MHYISWNMVFELFLKFLLELLKIEKMYSKISKSKKFLIGLEKIRKSWMKLKTICIETRFCSYLGDISDELKDKSNDWRISFPWVYNYSSYVLNYDNYFICNDVLLITWFPV